MTVFMKTLSFSTQGDGDMIDVTTRVHDVLSASRINDGIATIFVPGSTASVTTIEYEPGLMKDFPRTMDKLAPKGEHYDHDARWGDGNGNSHVKASMIGPSLIVPFEKGRLLLGTWQQIVFIDFDNRPRERQMIVQVMGE
jgi:secondary thiamine-phosphate synthase enzyme